MSVQCNSVLLFIVSVYVFICTNVSIRTRTTVYQHARVCAYTNMWFVRIYAYRHLYVRLTRDVKIHIELYINMHECACTQTCALRVSTHTSTCTCDSPETRKYILKFTSTYIRVRAHKHVFCVHLHIVFTYTSTCMCDSPEHQIICWTYMNMHECACTQTCDLCVCTHTSTCTCDSPEM